LKDIVFCAQVHWAMRAKRQIRAWPRNYGR